MSKTSFMKVIPCCLLLFFLLQLVGASHRVLNQDAAAPTDSGTQAPLDAEAPAPADSEAASPDYSPATAPDNSKAASPDSPEAAAPDSPSAAPPDSSEAAPPDSSEEAASPESSGAASPDSSEAASPGGYEPAEFRYLKGLGPSASLPLPSDTGEAASPGPDSESPSQEVYAPPENPTGEDYTLTYPYEAAAFPSSDAEEPAAPELSPEDAAFYEEATFPVLSPAPAPDFDLRDQPCVPSDRAAEDIFFTCSDFNGYYCTSDQFGASGSTCDGGTYRCESLSSEPSVYGILASYPNPDAVFKSCMTSSQCDDGQFCDKSPKREYAGDIPIGNCVAYLNQGCLV